MRCTDIPEEPIIEFLSKLGTNRDPDVRCWATWYEGFPNSVQNAMPAGVPPKLALAKMRQMIKKGACLGCYCGCRGDFRLE
jgi:hypothetical protein